MAEYENEYVKCVLHWNYRNYKEFPKELLQPERSCELRHIYLKENAIEQLPPEISSLHCLQSLYLSGNDINVLPPEIGRLKCLSCLDLSGNRLEVLPDEIGDMAGLKCLILDENELTELPVRIRDLKYLRYFSVCDNKLKWLPQRPIHNYYHCEFRFWRNRMLNHMPYSLWYHMFRNQQIRCHDIGCLNLVGAYGKADDTPRCLLKMHAGSSERKIEIVFPRKQLQLTRSGLATPPTLSELATGTLYAALAGFPTTDKGQSINSIDRRIGKVKGIYSDAGETLNAGDKDVNIYKEAANEHCVLNDADFDNNVANKVVSSVMRVFERSGISDVDKSIGDLVDEKFSFLPRYWRQDLKRGPVAICENISCKRPLFSFHVVDFVVECIQVMDSCQDIILSAVFCCNGCKQQWRRHKKQVIHWEWMD